MDNKETNDSNGSNGSNGSKTGRLKIREMEIDDIAKVFHLGEDLFEAQSLQNLYRTWDEFEVVELFLGDSEFCLVAEYDDELVGFALGTTITKSRSAWKYGHLIWLGVAPGYQRAGVAEKLFNRFRQMMIEESVRMLIVDSQAGNLQGLRFFKKMGFSHPIEHIYLSMNLSETAPRQRRATQKKRTKTAKTARKAKAKVE
jgi:ribosomal protein S18 acetylase RimI-like enzyme